MTTRSTYPKCATCRHRQGASGYCVNPDAPVQVIGDVHDFGCVLHSSLDSAQPAAPAADAAEQAPRPWDEGGRDDYYSKLPGDARLVAGLNPLTEGATALRNRIQSARERLASDDLLGLNIALNDILGTYATAERVPTPTDETATLRAGLAKCEAEKAAVWQGHAELFARCTQLTLELAKARGWDGEHAPGQPSAERIFHELRAHRRRTWNRPADDEFEHWLSVLARRLGVKP